MEFLIYAPMVMIGIPVISIAVAFGVAIIVVADERKNNG